MRDVGRFAVAVAARPVVAYLNHGRKPEGGQRPLMSVAELREDARARPVDVGAAHVSAGIRLIAWVVIGLASLITYIAAAFLRRLEALLDPALVALMWLSVWTGLFASISIFVQIVRITIIASVGARGFPADGRTGRIGKGRRGGSGKRASHRTSRTIRWLCTPSQWDAVPAVLWTLLFAPLIIADIPPIR